MSFNTGNPLGSKDILDLYDNSENIDHFVNSQEDEHPDRFGVKRLTLAGLIKRSMALRNEINDFSGALPFTPVWSDVPMNVSAGVGGEGGALNLQASALGNRTEYLKESVDGLFSRSIDLSAAKYGIKGLATDINGVKQAISDAEEYGLSITAPKNLVIKLVGTDVLTFSSSCDFNHCKIDLSGFSGRIVFTDGGVWTTYDQTHPVVSKLNAVATLNGTVINAWDGVPEVENSFVKFNTNQDFYSYRQAVVKRNELNCHTRFGQLDSSFLYPLPGAAVTSVEVKKFPETYTVVKNINFYLGSNDTISDLVTISGSLLIFENVIFNQNNFKNMLKNQTWLSVIKSAYVQVRNVRFVWVSISGATSGYTYNIGMYDSYHLRFDNVKGTGDGWGATGSNLCRIIKFNECHLSRIDFHQPFSELMQISNSKLGSWGILVTAIGNLLIENTEFTISDNININNHGYIRSRDDTGGFCDGDLKIRNCFFTDTTSAAIQDLVKHQYTNNPKPAGSPITYRYWRTIEINGIGCNKRLNLAPNIVPNVGISYPIKISVRNGIRGDFEFTSRDFKDYIPAITKLNPSNTPISNYPNVSISIDDLNLRFFYVIEAASSNKFNFHVNLSKIYNTERNTGCLVETTVEGVLNITDSIIGGLDFYSGGSTNKYLWVSMMGGALKHDGSENQDPLNGFNSFVSVNLINVLISTISEAMLGVIAKAKVSNCNYIVADAAQQGLLIGNFNTNSGWSGPVELPIPASFNRMNMLTLITGFDSDNSRKSHTFMLPKANCSIAIEYLPGSHLTVTTGAGNSKITVSSTEYATLASVPRSLYVYS